MSLTMYEKYGTSSVAEAQDVNWKLATDPANEYFFHPVMRPVLDQDQTCSMTKYNYFRVTDAASVESCEIIIVSPYKTKVKGTIAADGTVSLAYVGSGLTEADYNYPEGSPTGIGLYNGAQLVGVATLDTELGVASSALAIKVNGAYVAGSFSSKTVTETQYDADDFSVIPEVAKRAKETRLYYKISSTFVEPTTDPDYDMMFAGYGNVTIQVPLVASGPETPYTVINSSYTGIDLYTPYIVTQLRANASAWNDVGNSPQYKIMFKCKIRN